MDEDPHAPGDAAPARPAATAAGDRPLQPLLHDLVTCLRAPTQVWSGRDGQVRPTGAQGAYHGDVRVLSLAVLTVGGNEPESVASVPRGADEVLFVGLARRLGDPGPDPTVAVERCRRVSAGGVLEQITVRSTAHDRVQAEITLSVACDLAAMDGVRAGLTGDTMPPGSAEGGLRWSSAGVAVQVWAEGAAVDPAAGTLAWRIDLPARGEATVTWRLEASDDRAVVAAPVTGPEWEPPHITAGDVRLPALVTRALDDLAALRMVTADEPDDPFVAAGAPWFFTLFGRDSLWAARMLLPLGTGIAASTLRVLARRQGRRVDVGGAEEPGKVMHELRRDEVHLEQSRNMSVVLPPAYYGTIDATPLWVCLLHDAWRWGMPEAEVAALLPAAEAALSWMAEHGDADGDGFLEYVDRSGTGLSNQGWKDSADAVQWRDGRLASPPIALCEVQGYAHEAAVSGAALLAAFGRPGADRWLDWAAALAGRFRQRFWVEDARGRYPAVALDADKRPVDTLTSNIGHLLGTGLLDDGESALVGQRVGSPEMFSGFGLRTMSTAADGFGPLSYHCGSVWPHDTAIVLAGLARSGRTAEAAAFVEGLLAAGAAFDYRLPELFGGEDRGQVPRPVPYPAACRPQAWAAAAAVAVLDAVLGLRPDVPQGRLRLAPLAPSPVGPVAARGLRVAGGPLTIGVREDGTAYGIEAPDGLAVETE